MTDTACCMKWYYDVPRHTTGQLHFQIRNSYYTRNFIYILTKRNNISVTSNQPTGRRMDIQIPAQAKNFLRAFMSQRCMYQLSLQSHGYWAFPQAQSSQGMRLTILLHPQLNSWLCGAIPQQPTHSFRGQLLIKHCKYFFFYLTFKKQMSSM